LSVLIWALSLAVGIAALYRATLAITYLAGVAGRARRRQPTGPGPRCRFQVIVPAHDEELLIADLIASIRQARFAQSDISILVLADNCSDRTAERVRELGEEVVERSDPDNRGKGQALGWLFAQRKFTECDAIALFDADNLVEPDFFSEVAHELAAGARCVQGYYDIANPDESIMTRLLAVTYVMKNLLYNAGKARLGLSVLLMGTGMVFTRATIERFGWGATSIAEDYEQSLNLAAAGERVRFVHTARTRAQESSSLSQGYAQRQRWLSGRRVLARRAVEMCRSGIRERSLLMFDIGLDLLMPSYATLLNATLITLVLALSLLPLDAWATRVVAGVFVYQVVEVMVALVLLRASPRFLVSLAFTPVFLVWRGVIDVLALFGHRRDRWARTGRVAHTEIDTDGDPPRR
jgi:1,2-diacylglycerol 3-beta-glucosyltransferase